MNYEKFNDAMCRLRQAEEEFNKKLSETFNDAMCRLRQAEEEFNKKLSETFKPFVEETKEQELQEKEEWQVDLQVQIDEAYNKGLQDLYDACCILAKPVPDMRAVFSSSIMDKIILNYSPQEIIDKVNRWKAEKEQEEQELHVGDEIEYTYPGRKPEKRIVIGLYGGIADEKIIWTISSDLSSGCSWFSSECTFGDSYCKTGKHYDAIPFPKEIRR